MRNANRFYRGPRPRGSGPELPLELGFLVPVGR